MEQVTESNSVAAVSNTVMIKLEYGLLIVWATFQMCYNIRKRKYLDEN